MGSFPLVPGRQASSRVLKLGLFLLCAVQGSTQNGGGGHILGFSSSCEINLLKRLSGARGLISKMKGLSHVCTQMRGACLSTSCGDPTQWVLSGRSAVGPRSCICDKFPDDTEVAGPGATRGEPRARKTPDVPPTLPLQFHPGSATSQPGHPGRAF